MKEEEGIKPRKIKTEKGEEGRGTRRAGLDPIGRFLGGQEGRGGYIALESEKPSTEGKKVVYIPVNHNS